MTIEEINNLVLVDVIDTVRGRLYTNSDPIPERPDPLPEDFDDTVWYESLFNQEELDSEFISYVQELTDSENERLRKQDIIDRFEALDDKNSAFYGLYPDTPNSALFIKELSEQADHVDAEAKIAELEAKDTANKATKDATAYIDKRKAEYPKIEELIVALWEGDQTKIDELEDARQAVKALYPKG